MKAPTGEPPPRPAPPTTAEPLGPPRPPRRSLHARVRGAVGPWVELVLVVALAFGAAWGVQALVVKPFRIPSESMEPTLLVGDRVLVARFWYRVREPARGDVVVFHPPARDLEEEVVDGVPPGMVTGVDGSISYIKRVVGLPGEWIGGRQRRVWICDRKPANTSGDPGPGCRALREPYTQGPQRAFAFTRVPDDAVFVMGDNRDNSDDSRIIGPVPRANLIGRAFVRYWPPQRVGALG